MSGRHVKIKSSPYSSVPQSYSKLLRSQPLMPPCHLRLPASPEISVNFNQTHKFIELSLSQTQFGIEGIGLVGQNLQVAGSAAAVTQLRKPRRILGRQHQLLLMLPELAVLLISNQRVGN